jgi:hypothetical protein
MNALLNPEVLKLITPVSHGVLGAIVLASLNTLFTEGLRGVSGDFIRFLRKLPLVNRILSSILDGEVRDAVKLLAGSDASVSVPVIPIPANGLSAKDIMAIMDKVNCTIFFELEQTLFFTFTLSLILLYIL